jgi:hypothetical protein
MYISKRSSQYMMERVIFGASSTNTTCPDLFEKALAGQFRGICG